jgi:aspartyl-tRNA(Asn)/glutamyl-tRNA(Gln) amidotransferase subunit C
MSSSVEYFKQLALNLRFRLSDEEAQAIALEFDTLLSQMQLLEEIDTEGVEPMVYPNETPNTFLRSDDPSARLSHEAALANAPKATNGYFVVAKVVD